MTLTINLTGPSTTPGAPLVTPEAIDAAVNAALAGNAAVAAALVAAETARAEAAEAAGGGGGGAYQVTMRVGAPTIGSTGYGWLEPIVPSSESAAITGLTVLNELGGSALIAAARTSDNTAVGAENFVVGVFPITDRANTGLTGLYIEPHFLAAGGVLVAQEIGMVSTQAYVAVDPYTTQPAGATIGYRASAGKVSGNTNLSTAFDAILGITAKFGHVLNVGYGSVVTGTYGAEAIIMAENQGIGWYGKAGTLAAMIRSDANASFPAGPPNRIVFGNTAINFQTQDNAITFGIASGGVTVNGTLATGDGATSPASVYSAIFPGVTFADLAATSFVVPSTFTLGQRTGQAVYFRNQCAASGGGRNGVGRFVAGTAEVNGAASWGDNSLLQDAATRTVGTGTGRVLIGVERDFNVMNPGTQVFGATYGGNSLAQPTTANAVTVNPLGTGIKWVGAFVSMDGAATFGLSLGSASVSGNDVASQPVTLAYRDHTGVKQTVTLQAVSQGSGTNAFVTLASTGGMDLSIGGAVLYAGGATLSGGATIGGTVYASANSANFLSLSGNISGYGPTLAALGADASINLNLAAKGPAGVVAAAGPISEGGVLLSAKYAPIGGGSGAFTRGVYTASGAISLTNTLAILTAPSGTLAMTLANGTSDGQSMLIKNLGVISATVTLMLDGASQAVTFAAASAGTIRDSLTARWSTGDSTWLAA